MTEPSYRVNRTLYHEYPVALRRIYAEVVAETNPAARHAKLCKLGEVGLATMASYALSDYRNRRHQDPEPKVEKLIGGLQRLSLGHYMQLLRACSEALQPALFDHKAFGADDEATSLRRFGAAYAAIEESIALDAHNLKRLVALRLEQPAKIAWYQFWERFVEYRNRSEGHPSAHSWPVSNPEYHAVMTPLLEEALVDALAGNQVRRVFSEHPFAVLKSINVADKQYLHQAAGEDLGLPFAATIALDRAAPEVWATPGWSLDVGRSLLLNKLPSGAYDVAGVFWDLTQEGPPPPLRGMAAVQSPTLVTAEASTSPWRVGTGVAPGTCGELVQGFTGAGTPFHITCPIAKSTTVRVRIRRSPELTVAHLDGDLSKLELALARAAEMLRLESVEIRAERWSDLDVGKGMGSSTADIVAAARAVADASDRTFTAEELADIATGIESSDGSMYPGLVACNHKTGEVIKRFPWWPQFLVVMLTPKQRFNTESADFAGKDRLSDQFDALLDRLEIAARAQDTQAFADAATMSASLNQRFVPNALYPLIADRLDDFGANGLCVGHTGTVLGLLFDADRPEASKQAARAVLELQGQLPQSVDVDMTTTPPSPRT